MNVSLTPELERMIREKVETGRYASTSEVVREALRLLEQRDRSEQERLAGLRDIWHQGIASGPAGELDFRALKQKARARLRTKHTKP